MSRAKALKICKNLTKTINGIIPITQDNYHVTFESPRAKKSTLQKVLNKLVKKYKIKEIELANGIKNN